MKKIMTMLLAAMMLFMTGCGGEEEATNYPEVNGLEGVSLSVKEDTMKSTSATFVLTNDTDEAVAYSTFEYHLEEWKDGVWVEFVGTKESAWGEETTALEAGASAEIPISWKTLVGTTAKGKYRVILLVNDMPIAAEYGE